jgi:hypothetical protein
MKKVSLLVLLVVLALLSCAGVMGRQNSRRLQLQHARGAKAVIGEDVVGVCIDQGVDEDDIDPDEGAIDDGERDLECHVDDQYEILSDDDDEDEEEEVVGRSPVLDFAMKKYKGHRRIDPTSIVAIRAEFENKGTK